MTVNRDIPKHLLFAFLVYLSLTFAEWFGHKYMMHSRPGELLYTEQWAQTHYDHHKEVDNQGVVPFREDPRGMIFQWNTLSYFVIAAIAVLSLLNWVGGFNYPFYTMALLAIGISLAYGILWNTFHQKFHQVRLRYSWLKSFPSFETLSQSNNCFINWLYRNHIIHHMNKGNPKCNFNIVLPGADFLLGTYRGTIDNTVYCQEETEKSPKIEDLCNHPPTLEMLNKIHRFG